MDDRPENKRNEDDNIPLRKKLSLDCKSMACYRAVLKGLGEEKIYGVKLDKSKLEFYNK
jgi:hypothetical protein